MKLSTKLGIGFGVISLGCLYFLPRTHSTPSSVIVPNTAIVLPKPDPDCTINQEAQTQLHEAASHLTTDNKKLTSLQEAPSLEPKTDSKQVRDLKNDIDTWQTKYNIAATKFYTCP